MPPVTSVEQCPVSGDRCRASGCTAEKMRCKTFAQIIVNLASADVRNELDPSNSAHAEYLALGSNVGERTRSVVVSIAQTLGLEFDLFRAEVTDALKSKPGSGFDIDSLLE